MTFTEKRRDELLRHMALVVWRARDRAFGGTWDGRVNRLNELYIRRCTSDDDETGMRLIFSRDRGHHSSGWLKNPDYERCLHLSLSSWDAREGRPVGHLDRPMAGLWALAFFGPDVVRRAWVESPKSAQGKSLDVWHWRVFCDEHWQPILPRKEVYTLEFTELGWRSASQVLEEDGVVIESPLVPG